VGKNKFHYFWPPRKTLEKSRSPPPQEKSFRRPCLKHRTATDKHQVMEYVETILFQFTAINGVSDDIGPASSVRCEFREASYWKFQTFFANLLVRIRESLKFWIILYRLVHMCVMLIPSPGL